MDKNVVLAHFWANKNQLVTADGIRLELEHDKQVFIMTSLKTTTADYYDIVMSAAFELDDFIAEMEAQLVDDVTEINLDTMFAWLISGKADYLMTRPDHE